MHTERDKWSGLLFALHEAAQDAANDPSRETWAAVRKAYVAVDRAKALFFYEHTQRLIERSRETVGAPR